MAIVKRDDKYGVGSEIRSSTAVRMTFSARVLRTSALLSHAPFVASRQPQ